MLQARSASLQSAGTQEMKALMKDIELLTSAGINEGKRPNILKLAFVILAQYMPIFCDIFRAIFPAKISFILLLL